VDLGIIGQAAGLFAVTNIDDILILSLFFAQSAGHHSSARRIFIGQYLGFAAILAVAAAFGATLLPESAIPYLGLLPLALGLKAAWQAWKHRGDEDDERDFTEGGPRALEVAASPSPRAAPSATEAPLAGGDTAGRTNRCHGVTVYVCTSKVWPREFVGATVTEVPFTVTFRKWYTCASSVGTDAAPQAEPRLRL